MAHAEMYFLATRFPPTPSRHSFPANPFPPYVPATRVPPITNIYNLEKICDAMVIPSKRVSLPVTGTGHRTTAAPPTRRPEVQLRSPPKLLLLLTTSSSTAAAPPHHHLLPNRTSSTPPWLLPQAHKKLSHNKKNTVGRWRML